LSKAPKKRRLWELDPSIFDSGRRANFLERRVLDPARRLGKFALLALAFLYPVYMVVLGVAFGGLVFWGSFAGSIILLGLVLTKLGYARNFRDWDVSLRKFSGLVLAFFVALGFYFALLYDKIWLIPVAASLFFTVGLIVMLKKGAF